MAAPQPAAAAVVAGTPDANELRTLAGAENFDVAPAFLGARIRAHLSAIYGFARLVDSLGDEYEGDRPAALDWLETDLGRVFGGDEPQHPALARLAPSVHELPLPRGPFERLIEANRRDQAVHDYATFDELLGYCALSANPVGELVLHVFGAATAANVALSDRVCTALQLVEHWQDVGEDAHAGRVYLPREDREMFGVSFDALKAAYASDPVRALLAFECERARALLDEGAVLVGALRARARAAIAAYVGGGRAALDALNRSAYHVLPLPAKPTRLHRALVVARTYGAGR
jgi:squalene synthase HpnC